MTTIDDAIQAFAEAADEPPNAALRWALDHWDEAEPRFLAMLEAYTDGSDESDATADALFFIIHLFGDKGDRRAYRVLCRLMLDEDRLIATLGDQATVETLKGVLIKCFDGDVAPLREVIESTQADSITRGEALLALAWLVRDGRWPEQAVSRIFARPLTGDVTHAQVRTTYGAGLKSWSRDRRRTQGTRQCVEAKLIRDGGLPEEWLTLAEFPDLSRLAGLSSRDGLRAEDVVPFDDVIGSLADWPWPDDDEDWEEPAPNLISTHSPIVGRNDPCPCGSGKKFKNCHLVAE